MKPSSLVTAALTARDSHPLPYSPHAVAWGTCSRLSHNIWVTLQRTIRLIDYGTGIRQSIFWAESINQQILKAIRPGASVWSWWRPSGRRSQRHDVTEGAQLESRRPTQAKPLL